MLRNFLMSLFSFVVLTTLIFSQSKLPQGIPNLDFYLGGGQINNILPHQTDDVNTTLTWNTLATSSLAVSRSCIAYINIGGSDFIYQFGGGSGAQLTAVAKYDVAANTWTTAGLAAIPSAMSAATALTVGNYVYLFGGESVAGLGKTYKYDPVANTWTALAPMLTAVTDALVLKYNDNYVYVIGGGTGLFGTGYFNNVQLYDIGGNSYSQCTPYPVAAGMMGGGILENTIFSSAGWDGTGAIANSYIGEIDPGNLNTITWTPVADYPAGGTTRMASIEVILSNSYPTAAGFFFSGGAIGGSTITGNTYLYNYCTQTWETLTPTLPVPRSNMKACSDGLADVYVIAGYNGAAGIGDSHLAILSDIAGNCYVPVEFTAFTANTSDGNVTLNWSTATETNNRGFDVQRNSGNGFETVGFVQGNGTSTQVHNYSFIDKSLADGNYSYRLRQVDFDGTSAYSTTVEVQVVAPKVFSLDQNYPNPFNPSTQINFSLAADSKVSLKVYNILGQEVAALLNGNMTAGQHFVNFNASNLSSGVYIYKIEANGGNGKNFTAVKKMVLTK